MNQGYASNLSEEEWQLIAPLIPPGKKGGRPRTVDMRHVLDGIFYFLKTGCQWRMLPSDLPPWGTVHYYFRRFRNEGVWFKIHEHLRAKLRIYNQQDPDAAVGIMDSQSVKTTEKRGDHAGMMLLRKLKDVSVICS